MACRRHVDVPPPLSRPPASRHGRAALTWRVQRDEALAGGHAHGSLDAGVLCSLQRCGGSVGEVAWGD
eukprot:228230-Chlamydomonas_euryale.AAC.2